VPTGSSPGFDGIPPNQVNFYHTTAYSPAHATQAMAQPCRAPRGNDNMPANPWSTPAGLAGFVHDFHAFYTADQEVMGAYSADQLPVLYGLASNFAVSDRWFASVPTQTDANRAFSRHTRPGHSRS
jgi:phospholipase C